MIFIWCDSSIEPYNPGGILAWAFVAKDNKGNLLHQDVAISCWGKEATNNRGEYQAVVGAMLWLVSLPDEKRDTVVLQSDSQLIINQCSGSWRCHDSELKKYLAMVEKAKARYKKKIFFKWVPRDKNKEADALSRTLYTEEAIQLMKDKKLEIMFKDDDVSF